MKVSSNKGNHLRFAERTMIAFRALSAAVLSLAHIQVCASKAEKSSTIHAATHSNASADAVMMGNVCIFSNAPINATRIVIALKHPVAVRRSSALIQWYAMVIKFKATLAIRILNASPSTVSQTLANCQMHTSRKR